MAKKEMTWMDVIREQLAKLRKEGKKPSIGDVTPQAKKEWADIKAGKHPLYIQGSSKGIKRSKGNKTQKLSKKGTQKMMMSTGTANPNAAIQQMLSKVHLCKKCTMKIQKYLKTQKGGNCGCEQQGGKTKKNKKMKGGYVDETDRKTGEYASEESEKVNINRVEKANEPEEPKDLQETE